MPFQTETQLRLDGGTMYYQLQEYSNPQMKNNPQASIKSEIVQLYISQVGYNSNITSRTHEWNHNNSRLSFNRKERRITTT